jgi:hypothetical protein
MAIQLTRRRFSVRDFEQMIATGVFAEHERVELIDGEVVEMAPIGVRHAEGVRNVADEAAARGRGACIVEMQNPVRLGDLARPQPDVALLRPPRARYQGRLPAAADLILVVEVSDSSLAYDREVKVPLYAQAGVPEAWLVNLTDDEIAVYRDPTPEGFRSTRILRRGETISPLAFPDWAIPVEALLPGPLAG